VQRAAVLPFLDLFLRLERGFERLDQEDGGEGVDSLVFGGDLVEAGFGEFDGRDALFPDRVGGFEQRQSA
jgi:hypothetical protein